MRQRLTDNPFKRDPLGSKCRQRPGSAVRVSPEFSAAAAIMTTAVSLSHQTLAKLVTLGEKAQQLRSAEGLAHASSQTLDLPLGEDAYWIGRYYQALAINRLGKSHFDEADAILLQVADHGPQLFRAKAHAAIGTNYTLRGDNRTALDLYACATQIARRCEPGGLHTIYTVRFQNAVIEYFEGDSRRALVAFEELMPLALQMGSEFPPVLHHYCNNLAATLGASGRLEEALHFSKVIAGSPFSRAYPEWGATCADLAEKTRTRSRSVVAIPVAVREIGAGPDPGARPEGTLVPKTETSASKKSARHAGMMEQHSERALLRAGAARRRAIAAKFTFYSLSQPRDASILRMDWQCPEASVEVQLPRPGSARGPPRAAREPLTFSLSAVLAQSLGCAHCRYARVAGSILISVCPPHVKVRGPPVSAVRCPWRRCPHHFTGPPYFRTSSLLPIRSRPNPPDLFSRSRSRSPPSHTQAPCFQQSNHAKSPVQKRGLVLLADEISSQKIIPYATKEVA
jgi:hypothetical protein